MNWPVGFFTGQQISMGSPPRDVIHTPQNPKTKSTQFC